MMMALLPFHGTLIYDSLLAATHFNVCLRKQTFFQLTEVLYFFLRFPIYWSLWKMVPSISNRMASMSLRIWNPHLISLLSVYFQHLRLLLIGSF